METELSLALATVEPRATSRGRSQADQLFAMIEQFSNVRLIRVEAGVNAMFSIDLFADPSAASFVITLSEQGHRIATEQVRNRGSGHDQWEAVAAQFSKLLDLAAEVYARPPAR